ncbi:HAD domain-containing protein [Variovorax sp. ZS18.2.2]|uniref:HAD domain-containing protein n=1 Tax=Variovorax sp. ZS18.2.2 TaxID=2971255 RepID=UPI002150FC1C|nr:HAD domain-containing protein [Variovorax sp. ZS18.2.2]MCR6478389.1 HAD domain-containing protein [Variovorax sp. ZS18.2.2]
MILFLDFDGVLHPEGEDRIYDGGVDFCFLPRLEALLREFPFVKIVISSSWREHLLNKTLLKPFSSDIRTRIAGVIPPSGFGLQPPYRNREGEILAWLQIHDVVDEPWVALDDAYWQFDQCKDHLVVCGSFTGFDDRASAELRARFEGACQ